MNWLDRVRLRASLIVETFRAWRAAPPAPRRCPACGGTTCREVTVRIIDDQPKEPAGR
jgi:hypothetical protein